MRLTELEPRWIHENVFIFLCPHCQKCWLSCKNVQMKIGEQFKHFHAAMEGDPRNIMVPMNEGHAWTISGKDFETMTVTPSIDASPSGDWHGHITNGEIR